MYSHAEKEDSVWIWNAMATILCILYNITVVEADTERARPINRRIHGCHILCYFTPYQVDGVRPCQQRDSHPRKGTVLRQWPPAGERWILHSHHRDVQMQGHKVSKVLPVMFNTFLMIWKVIVFEKSYIRQILQHAWNRFVLLFSLIHMRYLRFMLLCRKVIAIPLMTNI